MGGGEADQTTVATIDTMMAAIAGIIRRRKDILLVLLIFV